jgi:branched-chain amino acid transport system permease protein
VPYEINLQADPGFVQTVTAWGYDPVTASSIVVKLAYTGLFGAVLLASCGSRRRRSSRPGAA